eukprot:1767955-Pyramimonas_sp.AAC.1
MSNPPPRRGRGRRSRACQQRRKPPHEPRVDRRAYGPTAVLPEPPASISAEGWGSARTSHGEKP